MNEVTRILHAIQEGQTQATAELLPLVYEELRCLAAAKMAQENAVLTLQPTAPVHEAWLRLGGDDQPAWENRAHYFGAAAEAMRRILVERARRRLRQQHGGGQERVDIDEVEIAAPTDDEDLLAMHDALDRFAALDPEKAEFVKLRYFVGLSLDGSASVLGVSLTTAKRWWQYARAWLKVEMHRN
ncbi:MAG: RNA polymerase subunit sigma [Pedosphaera sp.]|nr:RNA polymerase subunit sigma [Pedosphaera sp.]